jgi:hypothetical protein
VSLHGDLLGTNWYGAAGFEAWSREAVDLAQKLLFAAMEGICWKMMPLLGPQLGHMSTFGLIPRGEFGIPGRELFSVFIVTVQPYLVLRGRI